MENKLKKQVEADLKAKTENLNKKTRDGQKETMAAAKANKNDEFYTRYDDILNELEYYGKTGLFKGKKIILPCDTEFKNVRSLKKKIAELEKQGEDTTELVEKYETQMKINMKSQFHRVLTTKQEEWGIESITTSYWDGTLTDEENEKLGNKKFQDVDYSKYDIVMTNPPFSLFREFIDTMEENNMQYLIVGNNNAITYKETFKLIKDKKLWLGRMGIVVKFNVITPIGTEHTHKQAKVVDTFGRYEVAEIPFGVGCWFTNLGTSHDRPEFPLTEVYKSNENKYPKYDNYDAINVNKGVDIPSDYDEVMGVPITFLHKLNTEQFEILGIINGSKELNDENISHPFVKGKKLYARLLIRRVK